LQQQQMQQVEDFNNIQKQTFEQHKAEMLAANSGSNEKLIEEINKLRGELERQRQETSKWMNESQQLRKQLDRAQDEMASIQKNFSVERERFQNQLERILSELDQKEVNILIQVSKKSHILAFFILLYENCYN
jgi:predicted nuclease with TOPRIM domain